MSVNNGEEQIRKDTPEAGRRGKGEGTGPQTRDFGTALLVLMQT